MSWWQVQRRWQLFHTRSCHLGAGQSDVGHSLGHHHPSVGHRCLFFSKLLPLGDQALSAAIMFCQPLWSVRSISPKKISLDALASLDLKLSVTESVIYRFQLAQLRVFQIIFFRSKIFVTPSCFHLFGVNGPLEIREMQVQRNTSPSQEYLSWPKIGDVRTINQNIFVLLHQCFNFCI